MLLALCAGCRGARVVNLAPVSEDRQCRVTPNLLADDESLPATSAVISRRGPLTIVALGSSSTAGVGASSKRAAYPAVLERELRRRLDLQVRVLNRGVGGEVIERTAARIATDVLPYHPTLVIWQVGTNDLVRSRPLAAFEQILARGIMRMRARGCDVMLMTPQYFPAGELRANMKAYLRAIDRVADACDVPVLHRHQIMAYWAASGELSVHEMLARDLFHMSDEGYRCLGEVVADFILRHRSRSHPVKPLPESHRA